LKWQRIGAEFDHRRQFLEQELRQRLNKAKNRILDALLFDLSKTSNPKVWWEQDFPFYLRREFTQLAQGVEAFIIDALARDVQWLHETVAQTFRIHMQTSLVKSESSLAPNVDPQSLALADTLRQRLFSRIGSGAATILGYLLLGPVGVAISIGTGIASEALLRKQVEQQQRQLDFEVRISVERSIEEYLRRLSERLEEVYGRIAQDIRREHTTWEASRTKVLQGSEPPEANEKQWQRLIDEAATLQREIHEALARQ
jgi:hypothetical protein